MIKFKPNGFCQLLILGSIVFLFLPFTSIAATSSQPNIEIKLDLPVSVQDAYDTFKQMKLSTGTIHQVDASTTIVWLKDFKNLWQSINDWFTQNIGVSFKNILVAIGNIFVWLLELLVHLLKWIIGLVSGH